MRRVTLAYASNSWWKMAPHHFFFYCCYRRCLPTWYEMRLNNIPRRALLSRYFLPPKEMRSIHQTSPPNLTCGSLDSAGSHGKGEQGDPGGAVGGDQRDGGAAEAGQRGQGALEGGREEGEGTQQGRRVCLSSCIHTFSALNYEVKSVTELSFVFPF